jgi:ABC-type transport system involved in multi-copper enzyme maturation permease subunit
VIGPLFRWELVRLARRGHAVRARGILTLVVLAALFLFTIYRFWHIPIRELFFDRPQIRIEESAAFGELFAMTFLLAQLAVVIGLTPAYAAGGLAEEKEHRSIDFLLTSTLTDREIVLGPFLARVVFLIAVILTGFPILILTFLYGGVDPPLVLASYGVTLGTVVLLSAVSLFAAVSADSFRGAMFRSYSLTLLFALVGFGCFYISPLFVIFALRMARADLPTFLGIAITYPIIECLIAVAVTAWSVKSLRKTARSTPRPTVPAEPGLSPEQPIWEIPEVPLKPPIDEDRPFDWKEKYVLAHRPGEDDDAISGLKLTAYIVIGCGLLFFSCFSVLQGVGDGTTTKLSGIAAVGVACHLAFIGATACGAINTERARLTWESLLAIPVDHSTLLGAKYRVAIEKGWWWGIFAAMIFAIALGMKAGLGVFLAMIPYGAAAIIAAPVVGLYLSTQLPKASRAFLYFLGNAVGVPLLPIVASEALEGQAAVAILAGALALVAFGLLARRRALRGMVAP